MRHVFASALIALSASLPALAADAPPVLNEEMAAFFSGNWSGAGEFANGRKIEADASFQRELDGRWLLYRHTDKAPNKYKALGLWGYEAASGKLLMTVNDSFGGARRFESEGWADGKVVFLKPAGAAPGARHERFTFERLAPQRFKMSYESSADGTTWRLVDHLVFDRQS